jgi:hypothetical protein
MREAKEAVKDDLARQKVFGSLKVFFWAHGPWITHKIELGHFAKLIRTQARKYGPYRRKHRNEISGGTK